MAKKLVLALSFLVIVLSAALVISLTSRPNKIEVTGAATSYDSLAKCLSDKGVKFYGAWWCSHCQNQKQMFGTAQNDLPYVECSTPDKEQLDVCNEAGVRAYPTWVFPNGQKVEGELSIDKLKEMSGC